MKKSTIIIIGLLLLLVFAVFIRVFNKNQTPPPIQTTTIYPTKPAPTGVPYEKLYTDPDKKFHIIYYPSAERYRITITKSPFEKIRPVAEKALIKQLKITNSEACKKNIVISTPNFANPDFSGKDYPLSFCSPTVTTP